MSGNDRTIRQVVRFGQTVGSCQKPERGTCALTPAAWGTLSVANRSVRSLKVVQWRTRHCRQRVIAAKGRCNRAISPFSGPKFSISGSTVVLMQTQMTSDTGPDPCGGPFQYGRQDRLHGSGAGPRSAGALHCAATALPVDAVALLCCGWSSAEPPRRHDRRSRKAFGPYGRQQRRGGWLPDRSPSSRLRR